MWNSSSAFCSGNNWEFLGTGEVAELTRVTEQLTSMLNVMQRWDADNVGQNRELFTVNFVTRSGEVKVVEARGTWHGTHGVSNEFNERKRQQRVEHVSNDNTSCASWNTSKHETPQAALRDLVGARRGAAAPRSVGASQRFVLHMCHVCDVNMSRKILRWWYNII